MNEKHHSEETRRKISNKLKGENNPMFGKHHTEETRRKISNKLKGENHPLYGKHHSEETRKKISNKLRGEKNPMSIKVIAFTDSASYYQEFASIREAGRELGVDSSSITKCCKGKIKSLGKYNGEKIRWKYKES